MKFDSIREWLIHKFIEIETRLLQVLDQLSDEQLNWRPNESSNSIANLLVHIAGNISERISTGINNVESMRNRDQEFETLNMNKSELSTLIQKGFKEIVETSRHISDEELNQTQLIRNRPRRNMDILLQSVTHYSEHMGQALYIAKICLGEEYKSTSIPKRTKKHQD